MSGVIGAEEMFDLSEFRDGLETAGVHIVSLT